MFEFTTLPTRKGRFLEATIEPSIEKGAQLLFEPKVQSLQTRGLSTLLSVASSAKILVPLLNMGFSNSDVKDVSGTVELIDEEIADDKNLSSSCTQVQVQS